MEAVAQDRGFPPLSRTVEVQIDVVDRANNPPVWDQVVYGPIYVKENRNIDEKVVAVKARSVFVCVHPSSLVPRPSILDPRLSLSLFVRPSSSLPGHLLVFEMTK